MRIIDENMFILIGVGMAVIFIVIGLFVRRIKQKDQNRNSFGGGNLGSTVTLLGGVDTEGSQHIDISSRAASLFLGPENYNCAQAILCTFQNCVSVQDAEIIAARSMGYGKVPGGLCGALYAAISLLNDPVKSKQLTTDFEKSAGSCRCKEILKIKRISCKECVALTAQLLTEHLCEQPPAGPVADL
jgi:hypothetical protein